MQLAEPTSEEFSHEPLVALDLSVSLRVGAWMAEALRVQRFGHPHSRNQIHLEARG